MPTASPFQIVIVGGGIAGLCAAIALRGPGRQITILEQSRLLSEIGATISLQPNASRILDKEWKLGHLLGKASGTVDNGFRIYNAEGRLVNEVPLLTRTEYGGDRIMYHRQDLHEALRLAAIDTGRPGTPAKIRTSAKVVSCDCDAGLLSLQDGERIFGDLVIGADGVHSVLRDIVVNYKVKTIPTGLSAYRLIVSTEALEDKSPHFCDNIKPSQPFTSMMMAHSCRLIMGPARHGTVYSVVGLVPDDRMNEDPDSKQSWVSRGDLEKMLETYKDFPDWVKTSFGVAEDIGLWQLRDIDPLPTWTRGRVLLIGDASHAMCKQPTSVLLMKLTLTASTNTRTRRIASRRGRRSAGCVLRRHSGRPNATRHQANAGKGVPMQV
jgi:salicylate hydroxylase